MCDFAENNGVRVVIIAGDMFDTEKVSLKAQARILGTIADKKDVDFLYLSGNHDEQSFILKSENFDKNSMKACIENFNKSFVLSKKKFNIEYQKIINAKGAKIILDKWEKFGILEKVNNFLKEEK